MNYSDNSNSQPSLVFLVGPPRSGTTWLQRVLAAHSDIGTAQESHIFNHFFNTQFKSWQLMRDFEDGRGGIGLPAYLTEEEFFQMIRQQLHFCLSKSPQYNKGSWFLEKTPDHLLHVGDIKRVIPNARLIVMTRNSEDVIESMMNAGNGWGSSWAPTSLPGAIKLYKRYEKALDNIFSGQTIMPHDYICVSYENLKKDTTSVVESILDYLELETEPDLINSMIAKPSELYKTGEFGKEHGSLVVEPTGFSRNSKEKLNLVQRSLIAMTTRNSFGYRPG